MGLNKDSNKEEVEQAIESGKITNLLNYIDVINGDSYLIKPSTIHAIGKSTFLIEIQQSADITYRLYDFNRVDSNGKHRQLHVKQALDCLDYKRLEIDKNTMQNEHLISCPYFNVYKYKIDGQKTLNATEKSFHSLTIIEGTGTIEIDGKKHQFKPYDSFFISAGSNSYIIAGNTTIILATL
ncbi:MAG: class I mannose-6-phosphate isomerase [Mycoplasmoidaceae bacterium]|nr:class I mannose-6-phosphate isomerase [Mycoplasmoidaceae bacterium]